VLLYIVKKYRSAEEWGTREEDMYWSMLIFRANLLKPLDPSELKRLGLLAGDEVKKTQEESAVLLTPRP
jgi:hypothetical protein